MSDREHCLPLAPGFGTRTAVLGVAATSTWCPHSRLAPVTARGCRARGPGSLRPSVVLGRTVFQAPPSRTPESDKDRSAQAREARFALSNGRRAFVVSRGRGARAGAAAGAAGAGALRLVARPAVLASLRAKLFSAGRWGWLVAGGRPLRLSGHREKVASLSGGVLEVSTLAPVGEAWPRALSWSGGGWSGHGRQVHGGQPLPHPIHRERGTLCPQRKVGGEVAGQGKATGVRLGPEPGLLSRLHGQDVSAPISFINPVTRNPPL